MAFGNADVPALRGVPFSKLRFDWERGMADDSLVPYRYGEALVVSAFGVDATPYVEVMTRLTEEAVARLCRDVAHLTAESRGLADRIKEDWRLNDRQKQLLCAAVDDEELKVDILSYAQLCNASPSTARNDLSRLVQLGLCQMTLEGKKKVYRCLPGRREG